MRVASGQRYERAEELIERLALPETSAVVLRQKGCSQLVFDYVARVEPDQGSTLLAEYSVWLSQPVFSQGQCVTCGKNRQDCQAGRPELTKNHFEVGLLDQPDLFLQRQDRRQQRQRRIAEDLVNKFLRWNLSGTDGEGRVFGPQTDSFVSFRQTGCPGLYARLLQSIWEHSSKAKPLQELMLLVLVLRDEEARQGMDYPEADMKENSLLALQEVADDFLSFQDWRLNDQLKKAPVDLAYSDTLILGKIFQLSTQPDTTTETEVALMQIFSNFLYDLAQRDGYLG